ncbi:MAG: hypothetical protein IJT94_15325 [Oscillibacter sp.]|nr:hypothetical protein [Oscillibacter sp.]
MVVPMQQVQTDLPDYLHMVETGQEAEIIIIRQGKPVARVTAVQDAKPSKRIGVARGRLKVPEDLDKYNDEIAELLGVTP